MDADSHKTTKRKLQYFQDKQALRLNVRSVVRTSHPTNLLRYSPLKGRSATQTLRSPGGIRRTAMPQNLPFPYFLGASLTDHRIFLKTNSDY